MVERFDFTDGEMSKEKLPDSPQKLFEIWIENAKGNKVAEYNAMVLSTLGMNDRISSRIVYVRGITEDGIIFFTNYLSRKGVEAIEHDYVSVNFFWRELEQQIRIEGRIQKVDESVSDEYFNNRPRKSQIGAWASNQSEDIPNRDHLENRVVELERKYEGKDVPRPPHWGGYIIVPDYYEFWQGRASRLHDRLVYSLTENGWNLKRIAP